MRIEVIKEEVIDDKVSLITCCYYSFWHFINKKSYLIEYLIRSDSLNIPEVIKMPEVIMIDPYAGFLFKNEHTKVIEALTDFRLQKQLDIYREEIKKKYSNLYLDRRGYR